MKAPALRIVCNIASGNDSQTQVLIDATPHALPSLLSLLQSYPQRAAIQSEACLAISNITAGNASHIQAVIDGCIIPPLVNLLLLHTGAEFGVKKQALWALSNATHRATPDQIDYLVAQGSIEAICSMLTAKDARVIVVALEGLDNILREGQKGSEKNKYVEHFEKVEGGGALANLEQLQMHSSIDVHEKASSILSKYFFFLADDEEPAMIVVDADEGGTGHPFKLGALYDSLPKKIKHLK